MRAVLNSLVLLAVGAIGGYAFAEQATLEQYLPLTAAPVHHQAILENDDVRVLDVRIPPGDTVPAHQHNLPSIFITLSPADLVLRNLAGDAVRHVRRDRSREGEPHVEWRSPAPEPRVVSNIDSVELRALRVELKAP